MLKEHSEILGRYNDVFVDAALNDDDKEVRNAAALTLGEMKEDELRSHVDGRVAKVRMRNSAAMPCRPARSQCSACVPAQVFQGWQPRAPKAAADAPAAMKELERSTEAVLRATELLLSLPKLKRGALNDAPSLTKALEVLLDSGAAAADVTTRSSQAHGASPRAAPNLGGSTVWGEFDARAATQDVRQAAARVVAHMPLKPLAKLLTREVDGKRVIVRSLGENEPRVRLALLEAVVAYGELDPRDVWKNIFLLSRDRDRAADGRAQHDGERSPFLSLLLTMLEGAAADDNAKAERVAACRVFRAALCGSADCDARDAIVAALKKTLGDNRGSAELRTEAALALGVLPLEKVQEALVERLDASREKKQSVRVVALETLGGYPEADAKLFSKQLVTSDAKGGHEVVRRAAARVLKERPSHDLEAVAITQAIMRALADAHKEVWSAAVQMLGRLRAEALVPCTSDLVEELLRSIGDLPEDVLKAKTHALHKLAQGLPAALEAHADRLAQHILQSCPSRSTSSEQDRRSGSVRKVAAVLRRLPASQVVRLTTERIAPWLCREAQRGQATEAGADHPAWAVIAPLFADLNSTDAECLACWADEFWNAPAVTYRGLLQLALALLRRAEQKRSVDSEAAGEWKEASEALQVLATSLLETLPDSEAHQVLGWVLDAGEDNVIELCVQEELLEVLGARLVQEKLRQRWSGDPDATLREMARSSNLYFALLVLLELAALAVLGTCPQLERGWWVYLVPLVPVQLVAVGLLTFRRADARSIALLIAQQTLLCPVALLLLFLPRSTRLGIVVAALVFFIAGNAMGGWGRYASARSRFLLCVGLTPLLPLVMPAVSLTIVITLGAPLLAVAACPWLEDLLEKGDVSAAELAAWVEQGRAGGGSITLGRQLLLPLHILATPAAKFYGGWLCNVSLAFLLPFVVPTAAASTAALAAMLCWIIAALAQERKELDQFQLWLGDRLNHLESAGFLLALVGVSYPLGMMLAMVPFDASTWLAYMGSHPIAWDPDEGGADSAAMEALHSMGHPQDAVVAAATIFLLMAQALRFLMRSDVTGPLVLMLTRMVYEDFMQWAQRRVKLAISWSRARSLLTRRLCARISLQVVAPPRRRARPLRPRLLDAV